MSDKIIYCRCIHSELFPANARDLFQKILEASGRNIYIIDDLCSKVAEREGEFIDAVQRGEVAIIACHPRAVKWLLVSAGVKLDIVDSIDYFNLMKQSIVEIFKALRIDIPNKYRDKVNKNHIPLQSQKEDLLEEKSNIEKNYALMNNQKSDRSWFPVIDYAKCTNCGACLDFCLFGVYEKREDNSIAVKAPLNCKDNCPACARICPNNAVIFPKYDKPPINGDNDESSCDTPHRTPIFAMSGDELYRALLKRNKKTDKKLYKNNNNSTACGITKKV